MVSHSDGAKSRVGKLSQKSFGAEMVLTLNSHIPSEVSDVIGFYVYALRDPRDRQVFYVGKGKGDRALSHIREAGRDPSSERAKLKRIHDIESAGLKVEHLFIRTHLNSEEEAFRIEQSVIDAYYASGIPLSNLVKGHGSSKFGLASVNTVVAELSALPAPASLEPVIFFVINKFWRPDSNEDDVYLYTREYWLVGAETREKARYAFGVAHGIIRGVYKIDSWYRSRKKGEARRWGFNGIDAPEMIHFIGTSVRRFNVEGRRSPFRKYLSGIPAPD